MQGEIPKEGWTWADTARMKRSRAEAAKAASLPVGRKRKTAAEVGKETLKKRRLRDKAQAAKFLAEFLENLRILRGTAKGARDKHADTLCL